MTEKIQGGYIILALLYFEVMITGAFDREGQRAEKKNSGDRIQETEWMPDPRFWIPEKPKDHFTDDRVEVRHNRAKMAKVSTVIETF